MNIEWGSEESHRFVTNVGLITTKGSLGHNIMACEWTHHVSYETGMIAICVDKENFTNELIKKTKEFGVSLASLEQTKLCSLAGGSSGRDVDKIKFLESLGFKFYKGKKIKPLMVVDAALNMECKLVKKVELPEHTMFIGEVVDVRMSGKEPLALHAGKYWRLTESLPKPSDAERAELKKKREEFKR